MRLCLQGTTPIILTFLTLYSGTIFVHGYLPASSNTCDDLVCLNGGSCSLNGSKPICNCTIGYSGRRCEHRDACALNPCHSHGRCISNNLGQYQCACEPGWTGKDCSEDVDECSVDDHSPCAHAGDCINLPGSFVCRCPVGFIGPRCEEVVLECANQPCRNGGRCVEGTGQYRCECAPGYEGRDCELEINECSGLPCGSNGQCEDLVGAYKCNCFPGWTGRHCDIRMPTCADKPCQNNASCEDTALSSGVFDRGPGFRCHCPSGFTGELCQTPINPCDRITCANGGFCKQGECLCPPGFGGLNCEIGTEFTSDQSVTPLRRSVEYPVTASSSTSYETATHSALKCSDEMCLNGGQCLNASHCHCPPGYTGVRCENDLCSSNPCLNDGACISNAATPDGFSCQCAHGFQGARCQVKLSACSTQPCGPYGRCVDQVDGYRCECVYDSDGSRCAGKLNSSLILAHSRNLSTVVNLDACPVDTCANGAQCVNLRSSSLRDSQQVRSDYACQCDTAVGRFDGPRCDIDVDECVVGLVSDMEKPTCLNGGQCVNTYGSYFCRCPPGWFGDRCETKWRACSHGYQPVCRNGGTCVEHESGFECVCPPGFTGPLCETELDDCAGAPCQNNGICFDLIGSYLCLCSAGWTGRNCEQAMNEMPVDRDCNTDGVCTAEDCLNGGLWHQNQTYRGCLCPPGYIGPRCEGQLNLCRIDPQAIWSSQADEQQQLVRWINHAVPKHMTAPTRQYWLHALITALRQLSHSSANSTTMNAVSNGICDPQGVSQCIPQPGNFTCLCRVDYHGSLCERPRDHCQEAEAELGEAYCMNGGLCETQVIVNPENGTLSGIATCHCPSGYAGSRCQLFTDVCLPNPCLHGGACQPILHTSSFPSIKMSHDRIEQLHPAGELGHGGPSYRCLCPPDRAGRHCEVDRQTACLPDSTLWCSQDARCIAGPEGPKCNCPAGFCGTHCEQNGTACAPQIRPESAFASWLGSAFESDTCEWNQCAAKRGNGRCDRECDQLSCGFDGLECILSVTDPLDALDQLPGSDDHGRLQQQSQEQQQQQRQQQQSFEDRNSTIGIQPKPSLPWSNCTAIRQNGIPCHLRFADDRCDEACASEACLFDGWDCETEVRSVVTTMAVTPTETIAVECPSGCERSSSNVECAPGCSITSTATPGIVDGAAGENRTAATAVLSGNLVLLVRISPNELFASNGQETKHMNQLLSGLSHLLHLNVSLKRQAGGTGQWMVYAVPLIKLNMKPDERSRPTQAGDESNWRIRSRRAASDEFEPAQADGPPIGSQLYLQLDATSCTARGGSCFQNVDRAAQFITASMHHRQYPFLRPVLSVQSSPAIRWTPIDRGHNRRWQPFDWLWSVNWPLYAVVALVGMLILMVLIGVMFTASQVNQRPGCPSAAHRRSLSAYLHKIGKKRSARKVQRAKIWFPDHGLLGRVRPVHKPGSGSSSQAPSTHTRHHLLGTGVHKPQHHYPHQHSYPQQNYAASDSDRLSLMWYLSGEATECKPSGYLPAAPDTASPVSKRARRSQVSTFLSTTDTAQTSLLGNSSVAGSIPEQGRVLAGDRLIKPESALDTQRMVMSHAPTSYPGAEDARTRIGKAQIGAETTSNSSGSSRSSGAGAVFGPSGCEGGSGSTTTTTTNTASTRVDAGGSDQDTLNTLQWDRASMGPGSETWSFYQIIVRLLQSNGLEDLNMQPFCSTNEAEASVLIRSILQHTINADRQEQARTSTATVTMVDAHTLNPASGASGTHICTELNSMCPILYPRLSRLLDFRLIETGETLLHAAARLNQAASCTDLLDAGADPTSVDNAGRTALLSAVSSGALDAIHVILAHPSVTSNPMCFVPSFLTDSTTPLMQAIKLGDVDAFRVILHAMNMQICTLAKAHATANVSTPTAGPSAYPSVPQSSSHSNEPLSSTTAWPVPYGGYSSKDVVAARGLVSDSTIAVINEDNAMSLLDLNMADNLGRTALHWAAATDQPDMLGCLLEAGASLDVQTTCDETPLALAAREGALRACRLLLLAGANPDLADYLDRTPKQLAQAAGYEEIVRLFDTSAQTDSALLFHPTDSGRSMMGFPQGTHLAWPHLPYNARTKLIMDNPDRLHRVSQSQTPLFFPSCSKTDESRTGGTKQTTLTETDVSSDPVVWSDAKKFGEEQQTAKMTSINAYNNSMTNNEFSPVNFFDSDSFHPHLVAHYPTRRDSIPFKHSPEQTFYPCAHPSLFDPSDLDPPPPPAPPAPPAAPTACRCPCSDSNRFETNLSVPGPGENQITSSDSESPNHWSSSPSDTSPKNQYHQNARDTVLAKATGGQKTDYLTGIAPLGLSSLADSLTNRTCTLAAGVDHDHGAVMRTKQC